MTPLKDMINLNNSKNIQFENMPYYKEGNVIVILGNLGFGKTSFGEFLVENAINVGERHIISNVLIDKEYKNYHMMNTDIEFFEYYLKYNKNKKLGLLLDETAIFANSKRHMETNAVYTECLLLMLRKFYCFGIYICQRNELTLPTIRDLATMYIQKLGKKSAIVNIENKVNIPLIDIIDTEIPFNTHMPSTFRFCLNLELVLHEISKPKKDKTGLTKEESDNKLKEIIENQENYYNKDYKKFLENYKKS